MENRIQAGRFRFLLRQPTNEDHVLLDDVFGNGDKWQIVHGWVRGSVERLMSAYSCVHQWSFERRGAAPAFRALLAVGELVFSETDTGPHCPPTRRPDFIGVFICR